MNNSNLGNYHLHLLTSDYTNITQKIDTWVMGIQI